MPYARRSRAFTFVECMIAVGIIALLLAILLPVVSRARAHGRTAACISNLRQVDAAFRARDVGSRRTPRLPDPSDWVGVVVDSAPGAARLLECPDGDPEAAVPGMSARFDAWHGNGGGSPNGSRLLGDAKWRSTRVDLGPDHYRLSTQMRPNRPLEWLVIDYKRVANDMWQATVVQLPQGYRIDCRVLSDGRRFERVRQGFQITYGDAGRIDYGYNVMAGNLADAKAGKIVVMDYHDLWIDFNGFPVPANDDDDASEIPTRRHLGRVNALMSDGSVQTLALGDVQPASHLYAIGTDRGPNPGRQGAPTSNPGGGNGNGNGNGKGNGK